MSGQTFTATLRVRTGDGAQAKALAASLGPDDDAHVATRMEADTLVVECRAATVAALRRAVDDVLATLSVSEDVLGTGPFDA